MDFNKIPQILSLVVSSLNGLKTDDFYFVLSCFFFCFVLFFFVLTLEGLFVFIFRTEVEFSHFTIG